MSFFNSDATAGVALAGKILAVDNADLTPTASEIAGLIETTTTGSGGTDDNYLSLADNSAGVIVHGSTENTPDAPVTIWWVDNALDGDGTDVTITMAGGLTVTGNLTVNGTTTTVNSTTTTVDDPVFTLGGDSAPGSDDNKDRGIEFRYHTGSGAKLGFFGFDDSTGKFTFIPDATNSSEVFSGSTGILDANAAGLDAASVTEATAAVNTDYLFFFDGGASGTSAKESIVDFISSISPFRADSFSTTVPEYSSSTSITTSSIGSRVI